MENYKELGEYFGSIFDEVCMELYFRPKEITLDLSQCDADMLIYAMNNVDWSAYNPDNFGGEGVEAACVHFNDIENQLSDYFDFNEEED